MTPSQELALRRQFARQQAVAASVNYPLPSAREAARDAAVGPAPALRSAAAADLPYVVRLTDSGAYVAVAPLQVRDERSWVARNPGKTAGLGALILGGLYAVGDSEGWWSNDDDDEPRAAPAAPSVQAGRDAYVVTVSGTGNQGGISQDSHDSTVAE
jgi:hypothetical protein